MYMYIVVAVHSQDGMKLACANAVLAVLQGVSNEMYAVIQLALHEHFTHAQQMWKFRHV